MPMIRVSILKRDQNWNPGQVHNVCNPDNPIDATEAERETPVGSTHVRPRGRPPVPQESRLRELRLTPVDQKPIEWFTQDGISKIVAFEEGGHGTTKQLHYHAMIETTLSDAMIKTYCYKLTRGKGTEGNKAFMSREPPTPVEKSYWYCAKHKNCVFNIGYDEKDLQAWYASSDEYVSTLKRERETYRKIKSLGRKRELLSVEQDIANELQSRPADDQPTCYSTFIVERFLHLCKERNYDFPTKSQMDSIINRLRYPYVPAMVRAFYLRGMNPMDEYTHNVYQTRY